MKKPNTCLLFLCLFCLTTLGASKSRCHPDDEAGLLGFKAGITEDPSGVLSSWKSGTDCCSKWRHLDCQAFNGTNRVVSLSINFNQPQNPNQYLSGTISPALARVEHLWGLYLEDLLNLTGPFPEVVFHLPNLNYLYLDNNQFSGPLPQNIGDLTQLNVLSLEGNNFYGQIPSSIVKLNLNQIQLGRNRFSGPIPDFIPTFKNLEVLSLPENQFSGQIPNFFQSFQNLLFLNLSYNKFSGEIPASLALTNNTLNHLELSHNQLTGKIPNFIGAIANLITLDLSWNQFTGSVPETVGNLASLQNLDLSHNYLSNPLPSMNIQSIQTLDLSYNQFQLGKIPNWITSSSSISSLKLARCGIEMKLDDWNATEMQSYAFIDLSNNDISGTPIGLSNRAKNLVGFWASGNKMRFRMEDMRIEKRLKYLDLSKNLVYGKVPGSMRGLNELNVSYNHLCGRIPRGLKFPASAFAGNDCLCGSPLLACK